MQIARLSILVNGIVQGIGFRPFVYRLAKKHSLKGFVKNTANGVHIEVEGTATSLFKSELTKCAPPLSYIDNVSCKEIGLKGSNDFLIQSSVRANSHNTLVPPDIAICKDCLNELFSSNDRRYLYPFINCTNCGPRYTIIDKLPYDRAFTTMKDFPMCPSCSKEYEDPTNRRFHAQPNACFTCGPKVWLEYGNKPLTNGSINELIERVVQVLLDGSIIAIKGIGGFHLALDANNEDAISKLRKRKNRLRKPLAIMTLDIETASSFVHIDDKSRAMLEDARRPIVLLNRLTECFNGISGTNSKIGLMLPYAPLHYIILDALSKRQKGNTALVMTSANMSDEPIAIDNEQARSSLSNIADYFLMHNRDIRTRCDDSVVSFGQDNKPSFIRRSRGYVPTPIELPFSFSTDVMGVGGELKNTFCFIKGNKAFVSQHIGDLSNYEAYNFFTSSIEHFKKLLDIDPKVIAYDMHPAYLSSKWAMDMGEDKGIKVQHHHAHLASCMADNGLNNELVLGLIMDGTGYGLDGTIWGGECLIGNYEKFSRYSYFEPYPLAGGDRSIRDIWSCGFSYLHKACLGDPPLDLPFFKSANTTDRSIKLLVQILDKGINCPLTSSLGRLFDAVAAIIGLGNRADYEGEYAIRLMELAGGEIYKKPFDYEITKDYISISPLIRSIVDALLQGESITVISRRFHYTLLKIFKELLLKAREETSINRVVLSGGVFQNDIINSFLIKELEELGFNVYSNRQVPCNDGGLSLGQAIVGAFARDNKLI